MLPGKWENLQEGKIQNNMDPEKEILAWKRKGCLCFG